MSKILKKITKKYRWLRFLNKKVTKLSLLGASLVGLCISSGHSFAKYRDQNYGEDSAGTAAFDAQVLFIPEVVSVKALGESDVNKKCAFVSYFVLSFSKVEVKCEYDLSLRLGASSNSSWNASWDDTGDLNETSFTFSSTSNQAEPLSLVKDGNVYNRYEGLDELTKEEDLFVNNSAYFAKGSISENEIVYDWEATQLDSDGKTLTICENNSASPKEEHYYAVMFFINVTRNDNSTTLENSVMLYNLFVEQVGDLNE